VDDRLGQAFGEAFGQAWQQHRAYLIDLAYRMLGDIGRAEDVVQDAYARLLPARLDEIDDARGWLIVVTSRLCLDQIRSARARRELSQDPLDLDASADPSGPMPPDPADRVTLDDQVQSALRVMLERLHPAERIAFVLHDVFDVPFDTIAETLGRPVATCRQLARRARQKIAEDPPNLRYTLPTADQRHITQAFIAACATGEVDALLHLLDPDVSGEVDLGDPSAVRPGIVHGALPVARNLLAYWGAGNTLVTRPLADPLTLAGYRDRRLAGLLRLTVADGRITKIHVTVGFGQVPTVPA